MPRPRLILSALYYEIHCRLNQRRGRVGGRDPEKQDFVAARGLEVEGKSVWLFHLPFGFVFFFLNSIWGKNCFT